MTLKIKLLVYYLLYIFINIVFVILFYLSSIYSGSNGLDLNLLGGGNDGIFYYNQAINFKYGGQIFFTSIHSYILGSLLKLFNTESILLLRVFNTIPIFLIPFLIFIISNSKKYLHILLIYLCIYPTYLYYLDTSLYRDGWIILFYLLSISFFILFIRKHKPIYIILLFFSVLILYCYRDYAALNVIISILVYLFVSKNKKSLFIRILSIGLLLFSIYYMLGSDLIIPIVNMSLNDALNYRQQGQELFDGGSQFYIQLDNLNIFHFYFNLAKSIYLNVFGPSINLLNSIKYLCTFLFESLVFLIITLYIYSKKSFLDKEHIFIVISSMIWFFLISIINDNMGTATRLRMVGWIPLIIVFLDIFSYVTNIKKVKKPLINLKE